MVELIRAVKNMFSRIWVTRVCTFPTTTPMGNAGTGGMVYGRRESDYPSGNTFS
jgi:hypothetical protein